MARENKVELYGYVYGKVRVTVNKDKDPVEASVLIRTVRRDERRFCLDFSGLMTEEKRVKGLAGDAYGYRCTT